MEYYDTTKDGKNNYININLYQAKQLSENTIYAATVGSKLISLKLANQLPEGANAFINQWGEVIEELRALQNSPNFFVKTLFKNRIQDIFYTAILNRLEMFKPSETSGMDMMEPPTLAYSISTETQNILTNSKVYLDNNSSIMDYHSNTTFNDGGGKKAPNL